MQSKAAIILNDLYESPRIESPRSKKYANIESRLYTPTTAFANGTASKFDFKLSTWNSPKNEQSHVLDDHIQNCKINDKVESKLLVPTTSLINGKAEKVYGDPREQKWNSYHPHPFHSPRQEPPRHEPEPDRPFTPLSLTKKSSYKAVESKLMTPTLSHIYASRDKASLSANGKWNLGYHRESEHDVDNYNNMHGESSANFLTYKPKMFTRRSSYSNVQSRLLESTKALENSKIEKFQKIYDPREAGWKSYMTATRVTSVSNISELNNTICSLNSSPAVVTTNTSSIKTINIPSHRSSSVPRNFKEQSGNDFVAFKDMDTNIGRKPSVTSTCQSRHTSNSGIQQPNRLSILDQLLLKYTATQSD